MIACLPACTPAALSLSGTLNAWQRGTMLPVALVALEHDLSLQRLIKQSLQLGYLDLAEPAPADQPVAINDDRRGDPHHAIACRDGLAAVWAIGVRNLKPAQESTRVVLAVLEVDAHKPHAVTPVHLVG